MHPTQAPYPTTRFRRLRRTPALRALVQEHVLSAGDLIWPVFLCDGTGQRQPVASMPGVERLSLDLVVGAAAEAHDLGIPAICLFPYTDPALKTADCREAWNPENLTNRAIRAIKSFAPDAFIVAVSSCTQAKCIVNAIDAGASDFVTKPFLEERMADVLSKAGMFQKPALSGCE